MRRLVGAAGAIQSAAVSRLSSFRNAWKAIGERRNHWPASCLIVFLRSTPLNGIALAQFFKHRFRANAAYYLDIAWFQGAPTSTQHQNAEIVWRSHAAGASPAATGTTV